MAAAAPKLRNIGPKSAAWLRQVGLRTEADIVAIGPVEAYMRVRRAGFRPTLNLLYALEGALCGCHWQEVPEPRRQQLAQEAEAAIALLPPPRHKPLPLDELYDFLAQLVDAPLPAAGPAPAGVGSKRLRNGRLRASGWAPRWPDARDGYAALLDT